MPKNRPQAKGLWRLSYQLYSNSHHLYPSLLPVSHSLYIPTPSPVSDSNPLFLFNEPHEINLPTLSGESISQGLVCGACIIASSACSSPRWWNAGYKHARVKSKHCLQIENSHTCISQYLLSSPEKYSKSWIGNFSCAAGHSPTAGFSYLLLHVFE